MFIEHYSLQIVYSSGINKNSNDNIDANNDIIFIMKYIKIISSN